MALRSGIRSGMKVLSQSEEALPRSVTRLFHATTVKRMGGGHGHDEPYYLHARHMYNLGRMKHRTLKVSLAVLSVVGIGVAVPLFAVSFQQKKTASG